MTPAAERMIYTRGYQNGYKAIRRAGKEQREQRIEELENENVGVKEQRDAAETRVADANEECVVLRGIVEKNDATIETLEKALRDAAEHLVKMKDGAHNCAMCGVLYHEIVAVLEEKP